MEPRRHSGSTVTVFELLRGAHTANAKTRIEGMLAAMEIWEFDERVARMGADIDRELNSRGMRIDARDTFIAATAIARGVPLLTRNRRHFERVPGLVLEAL